MDFVNKWEPTLLLLGALGTILLPLVGFVFVLSVSSDFHAIHRKVEGLQASIKALEARERRNKLLAEHLYTLASLQARYSQRGIALLLKVYESSKHDANLDQVKAAFFEMTEQIETASHEVGIFSSSGDVREKALRSLAFGRSGPRTVELFDDLIALDLEDAADYKKYRRVLINGLWGFWRKTLEPASKKAESDR